MTEQPPETIVDVDEAEDTPDRDADGVEEDRLTGVAFYDTRELRYVGGVHPNKSAANRAEKDYRGDDRYVLRRV